MNKKRNFSLILFGIILIALLIELFKVTFTTAGDFSGYALVGNLVLKGENIYNNLLINTWPPFFSIVSVPIAIIDNFSKYLVRFLWLGGSIYAMFQIMNFTTKLTIKRKLTIFTLNNAMTMSQNYISIIHWAVLVPLIIIFRFLLDNLSNLQINIYMLLLAMLSIYLFSKNKDTLAALLLAFSISIKIYTIFLLIYFIIKREYKIAGFTILFCALFSIIPFFIFGIEETIDYYTIWYENSIVPFASVGHKNQSYFSMMRSLLIHESPGIKQPLNQAIYINILNLTIEQVKIVSFGIIATVGSVVVFLFRKKLTVRNNLNAFIEYALVLNLIPILSPLAWKAYFIFLFPSYFLNYLFIYKHKNKLNKTTNHYLKISYFVSIILTVFSSELFTGKYLSDILETFSCITIGSILIAVNLLIYYINFNKYYESLE